MKCPKCYHESSSEDLVRNIAECSCDCHKDTTWSNFYGLCLDTSGG